MANLLHELLTAAADRSPERDAVLDGDRRLTYRQLDAASSRVAGTLRARGVARGDRVGLWLPKSLEAVIAIFGVLKAGAAYVPVDPAAPPLRAAVILGDCGVRGLLST